MSSRYRLRRLRRAHGFPTPACEPRNIHALRQHLRARDEWLLSRRHADLAGRLGACEQLSRGHRLRRLRRSLLIPAPSIAAATTATSSFTTAALASLYATALSAGDATTNTAAALSAVDATTVTAAALGSRRATRQRLRSGSRGEW